MTTNILPDMSYCYKGWGQIATPLSIETPGGKQKHSGISVVRSYRTTEVQSRETLSTVRSYRTVEISSAPWRGGVKLTPPFCLVSNKGPTSLKRAATNCIHPQHF